MTQAWHYALGGETLAKAMLERDYTRRAEALGGGWAEADDVAQDTFIAAWTTLRSLKEKGYWVAGADMDGTVD